METHELRVIEHKIELRKMKDGSKVVHGVAAIFNSLSRSLGDFKERILPGAFDKTDMSDVSALFNHNVNQILARTFKGKGTLSLLVTNLGLEYEFTLPNHIYGKMLEESLTRGDIRHSSFAFNIASKGDNFFEDPKEGLVREIKHFKNVYEVCPVLNPAYLETSVNLRGFELWKKAQKKSVHSLSLDKLRLDHYKH